MTLVLKLDLDMVLIYHCAKKRVSIPSASKVTARTDTQTHRYTDSQTDRHTARQTHRQDKKNYGYVTPCFTLGG